MRRAIVAATTVSMLVVLSAGSALAGATTDTQNIRLDRCIDHEEPDGSIFTHCDDIHLVIHTTVRPNGDMSVSGNVRSHSTAYLNGVLESEQWSIDHFRDITRAGSPQVSMKRLQTTTTIPGSDQLRVCELRYHVANGQLQYGSTELVCDPPLDGGGEG